MVDITKFSDIDGLIACWHAGESTVTTTPDTNPLEVESISPAYPDLQINKDMVLHPTSQRKIFSGEYTLDNAPAWNSDTSEYTSAMYCELDAPLDLSEGYTLITTYEHFADVSGTCSAWGMYTDTGAYPQLRSSGGHKYRWGGAEFTNTFPFTRGTPYINVLVQSGAETKNIIDGDTWTIGARELATNITRFAFVGYLNYADPVNANCSQIQGKASLFGLYNRVLSPAEIDDIIALAQYWQTNGEAPPTPTFTSFGPVKTNASGDPSLDMTWQWRADENDTWQTATEVLSDASVEDAPGGPNDLEDGQTILHINTGQVSDTGQIRCLATTDYNLTGVGTYIENLLVDPAP